MMMINIAGLVLISLIIWWFWLYKPKAVDAAIDNEIKIVVNNGIYQPARIKIKAGQQTVLQFIRKDSSPCAAMVIFPHVDISEELPLDIDKSVLLPPMTLGEYPFHCQMQMYQGTLIVE
ncbi:cupredoxin domain-containing protein [Colwellia sp. 12G3]|uniref:cupredoxin domain-containing protein n=1 Tax=Colwellia sp. 12G3 TaxID=2058299 RepID=UPI000C349C52|nr:cupredoxin domain-containing protein [Colwellia sp. 12G3]PKI18153.1 plastocyanin [Colwellia sp. 12G3]